MTLSTQETLNIRQILELWFSRKKETEDILLEINSLKASMNFLKKSFLKKKHMTLWKEQLKLNFPHLKTVKIMKLYPALLQEQKKLVFTLMLTFLTRSLTVFFQLLKIILGLQFAKTFTAVFQLMKIQVNLQTAILLTFVLQTASAIWLQKMPGYRFVMNFLHI